MKPDDILDKVKKHLEDAKKDLLLALAEDKFEDFKRSIVDNLYVMAHKLHEMTDEL